ncbi:hypothetical protein [Hydrogenophaga sp. ANAO-22]|uniref:hypothetical protein n=1 Tax=Hydrogenophaga sp. ANAO-22 TaxID=3166645 RepID=UPI0036D41A81
MAELLRCQSSNFTDASLGPSFEVFDFGFKCIQLHIPVLPEQPVQSDLIRRADLNRAGSPIELIMRPVNPLTTSFRENWPHARVRLDFGYRPGTDIQIEPSRVYRPHGV